MLQCGGGTEHTPTNRLKAQASAYKMDIQHYTEEVGEPKLRNGVKPMSVKITYQEQFFTIFNVAHYNAEVHHHPACRS